jgi:protein-L-isoaspartate O-methyltransferase
MYPLTPDLIDFLLGAEAQAALADLREANLRDAVLLDRVSELRRRFAPAEAAVLVDQARLRLKARAKFPDAERLYLTDEALEQATSRAVALTHAAAFRAFNRVADLGCGIGADTLALAEVVPQVVAVELDPVRARLAELNITTSGLADRVRVIEGDWTKLTLDVEAAFVDPARRTVPGRHAGSRRLRGLSEMVPPISAIMELLHTVPHVAVKVAPGVDHAEVPPEAEVAFISEKGNLKEALLRFGDLRTGAKWEAVLLPGPDRLSSDMPAGPIAVREPIAYLYEPDPAILRAGLVTTLATQIGAAQIDATIAYLTTEAPVDTPFARIWRVERHGHFHLKTLNRWLRELEIGHVTLKKRGSPIDVDTFSRRLKPLPGGRPATVFFTRMQGVPWMVVGTEVIA